MNLQQLYYFKTVAELKHFTKAANKLLVAQPSLSHSISELESELGVSLFERGRGGVALTKYGELFLGYVEKSLALLDEGKEKLSDLIDPTGGTISFSYVSSLENFVSYVMTRYYGDNSGVYTMFHLSQATNRDIKKNILEGTTDLGVGTFMDDPNLSYQKIGEHELVLIVSTQHPLAKQKEVDLADLGQEKFITYDGTCDLRFFIEDLFKRVGITPNIVLESTHDTVIYSSVAANYGIALVPAPIKDSHYDVKVLKISNDLPKREIYLTWKKDKYISPAVANLRDYIIGRPTLFEACRNKSLPEKQGTK